MVRCMECLSLPPSELVWMFTAWAPPYVIRSQGDGKSVILPT